MAHQLSQLTNVKRVTLVLSIVIVSASGVMSQTTGATQTRQSDPQSWQRYTVKGEEFSVTLPTLPAMISSKVYETRLQKQRLERRLVAAADGVLYTVDVFENPKPKQSLEEFVAEQDANSGYDRATERNLIVNGFAGKEFVSRHKTGMMQFFATEKRLYRFTAIGSRPEDAGVKQFFSSIVLGKKTEGTKVSDGPGIPLENPAVVGRVYLAKEVDIKARIISKPEATYTDRARLRDITGSVVLRLVFAANGQVTDIRVITGLPYGLTERSIEAARRIRFVPAMKDGQPVSTLMQVVYTFNLF